MVNQVAQTRREVLRRYPWNFAETWALANKTTAPAFGYSDAYALPDDCVRILCVGDPVTADSRNRNYRILNQGKPDYRKIIAIDNGGASTIQLAYTADITNFNQWDPLAVKVLAIWLAMDAAKGITGSASYVQVLNSLLSEELKDAVGVDGQEQAMRQDIFSKVQQERDYAQFGGDGAYWTAVTGY